MSNKNENRHSTLTRHEKQLYNNYMEKWQILPSFTSHNCFTFKMHGLLDNRIWFTAYLPMYQCSKKKFFANIFDISNCWWWSEAKPLDDFSFFKTLQSVLFCNIWQVIILSNLDLSRSQQNSVQNRFIMKCKIFICSWTSFWIKFYGYCK